jgi:predicted ATP-grasp superfamily ATP-dependent carboligase
MVGALVEGLATLPEVTVRLAWAAGLPRPDLPAEIREPAVAGTDSLPDGHGWEECEAVWPIAPEGGGVLERASRAVPAAGRVLLGSDPEAVRTAASKQATAAALAAHGVPVVPTRRPEEGIPESRAGWVLKPDRSEGGQGIRYFPRKRELLAALGALERPGDWLIQPFVPGQAASLSLLVTRRAARVISLNRQRITFGPEAVHLHGVTPGPPPPADSPWTARTRDLLAALPGLWGFVGVDFVETVRGPVVLEVNPRLTTAFAGLSEGVRADVAGAIVREGCRCAMTG